MMDERGIQKLLDIGTAKRFAEGEYICHEGLPGEEMYFIISGCIDVYLRTMNEDEVLIAEKYPGDLAGEISILDRQPRNATCIAREDTLTIAIHRSRLRDLLVGCPEIAEKLLKEMAISVREMHSRIYRGETESQSTQIQPFSIIKGFREHNKPELKWAPENYLIKTVNGCPVCGKENTFYHLRLNAIPCTQVLPNQRHIYDGFEVLWHYIWQCSSCGYANYFANFYQMPKVNRAMILRLISMQNNYLEKLNPRYTCDKIILSYYRAIHFNESFNQANATLLAKLWRYLCWLYSDVDDLEMANYCRDKALFCYLYVYRKNLDGMHTGDARQQCAMIIAELYLEKGEFAKAKPFYEEVTKCSGRALAKKAFDRLFEMME